VLISATVARVPLSACLDSRVSMVSISLPGMCVEMCVAYACAGEGLCAPGLRSDVY